MSDNIKLKIFLENVVIRCKYLSEDEEECNRLKEVSYNGNDDDDMMMIMVINMLIVVVISINVI